MEFLTEDARGSWTRMRACFSHASAPALVLLVVLLVGTPLARAAAPGPTEYQVKAVFLFNFALFVDWPQEAFSDAESPFVIGVLGDDPFGAVLDDTVRGETVNHRPFVVRRYRNVGEIERCHILFISHSEEVRLPSILANLKQPGILTVSDAANFSQSGGMIRFATVQSKIHLKINLDAARAAKLTISSKLLRPAEIVSGGGG